MQIIQTGNLEKASFRRECLSKTLKGMWEFIKWGKFCIPQQGNIKMFLEFLKMAVKYPNNSGGSVRKNRFLKHLLSTGL